MDEFTTQEAAVLRGLARHMLEMLATAEKRAEANGYNAGYVDGCFTKSVKDKSDPVCEHNYFIGHCPECKRQQPQRLTRVVGRDLAVSDCVHGVKLTDPCINCSGKSSEPYVGQDADHMYKLTDNTNTVYWGKNREDCLRKRDGR